MKKENKKYLSSFLIFSFLVTTMLLFIPELNAMICPYNFLGTVIDVDRGSGIIKIHVDHENVGGFFVGEWELSDRILEGKTPNDDALSGIVVDDYVEAVSLGGPGGAWIALGKMRSDEEQVLTDIYGDPATLTTSTLGGVDISYRNEPDCYNCQGSCCVAKNTMIGGYRLDPGESCSYDVGEYHITVIFHSGEASASICTNEQMVILGPQPISNFTIHISEACAEGYTGNTRCRDNWTQREYRYSDCTTEWRDYENCDQYDDYVGEKYCKNGDVYRKYRDYYCENGECKYKEEERKIEDCEYGCEDGGCKPPLPTTLPPTTVAPITLPPTITPIPTTPSDDLTPEKKMELAKEYAPILYFYQKEQVKEPFSLIAAEYFISPAVSDKSSECYNLKKDGVEGAKELQERYNLSENPVYVNVVIDEYEGNEYLVIQYWFHYLYNYGRSIIPFILNHEGEWEMIEVILEYDDAILRNNEFPEPYLVAYSRHKGGEAHKWSNEIVEKEGSHPIVYVAYGTHGSYFQEGGIDLRNKGTRIEKVSLELLDDKEWLNFSGKWGGDEKSPVGPMFQKAEYLNTSNFKTYYVSKWYQPVLFAALAMHGTDISLGSPVYLLITNEKDQSIGYKGEEFVNEIPGAYPIITEDHEYYHLPNDTYSVEITAFEDGDIDLNISINDNGEVTYIAYENKQVTEKTKAYTTLDPSKKDYEIEMDEDGDGIIDETIKPDKIITYEDEEPETKTPIPTTPLSSNKILFFGIIIAIIITLVVLVFSRGRSQQSTEIPIVRERPSIERTTVRWIPKRETDRGTRIAKKPKKEAPRRERIEAVPQEIPLLEVHRAKKEDTGKSIVRIDKKTREKLGVKKGDFVYIVGEKKAKARVDTAYKEDTGKNMIRIDKKLREKTGIRFKDKIKIEKVEEDEE
ncbi:MAG: hypothetical protein B5M53_00390 [Candidatus Cloacimonas sp. 4484_209]|nr:MAG: hypothetical protein B5M53_00390 [Candidatus Cloacimonas sp. 4484_209]